MSYELRLTPEPGDWTAEVVEMGSGFPLWNGVGPSMEFALVDLVKKLAAELESRAEFLPEGYVDLADR